MGINDVLILFRTEFTITGKAPYEFRTRSSGLCMDSHGATYSVRALFHESNIRLCKTKIMTKNKTF